MPPITPRLAILFAAGLLVTACSGSSDSSGVSKPANTKWKRHVDDAGFEVSAPPRWKVADLDGTVSITSPDGAAALARPFLAADGSTADDCAAGPEDLFDEVLPGVSVSGSTEAVGDNDVTAEFTYDDGTGGILCHLDGRAGMAFAIAGPAATYESMRATLTKILTTLQFSAPADAAAPDPAADLEFTPWRDPNEGGFTMEVPDGWDVVGGLSRYSAVDVRTAVTLTSPDGGITVRVGDEHAGFFTPPTQALATGGYGVGDLAPFATGSLYVLPYAAGADFASFLANTDPLPGCAQPIVEDTTDRSDLSQPIFDLYQQANLTLITSVDAGELSYSCTNDGGLAGWQLALTTHAQSPGADIWTGDVLLGYLAPFDRSLEAQAVVQHLLATYHRDPDWEARQEGTTMAVSAIIAKANDEISAGISESYWTKSASEVHVFDNWSKATLGQTDVTDRATGDSWRVENGHNYYWRTDDGDIGGSDTAPDVDVTVLNDVG